MKISEKVKTMIMAGVLAVVGVGTALVPAGDAGAVDYRSRVGQGSDAVKDEGNNATLTEIVNNIINIVLYVVGLIAVVMVIVGGVQYATSAGDTNKVTKAKNTILYGIVGLVISVLAYAIVNFVITGLQGS